ncbi:ferredoxin [Catellatospora sp. KI3]|uniref:ferredoxin n=1 Tax=Catellatospora sp. KI3 TaxID=3041620 RepID=UPI0024822ED1|nr:ferredoxin [Catellatospora sp. KI3]MDI1461115.1 ferredoxin [Catellatospora sp. KI3]
MSRWRISVDHDACAGSGTCTSIAPKRFRLNAQSLSVPIQELIEPDDDVLEAAEICPAAAITIRDAETGATIS